MKLEAIQKLDCIKDGDVLKIERLGFLFTQNNEGK